jgi:hypothetical protein
MAKPGTRLAPVRSVARLPRAIGADGVADGI